tara:strand:- start:356 stop:793 length:438 start_codon:yes stop_codon:yes gene_type:complete
MTHKELELLVVDLQDNNEIVTDIYERYVVYESYKRFAEKQIPLNLKWIQSTLKLSFPKVKKIVDSLVQNGFLNREQAKDDKRIFNLHPSEKLIKGIELFEKMKVNELSDLNFQAKKIKNMPNLSELTPESIELIKNNHLFFNVNS